MTLESQHTYARGRTRWVVVLEYIHGRPYVDVMVAYGKNKGRQYQAPLTELGPFYRMRYTAATQ